MIYLVFIFFLAALALIYDLYGARRFRNSFYCIAAIALILLAGFRFEVGGDTFSYMQYYKNAPTLLDYSFTTDLSISFQPLWIFLVACTKTVNSSFYTLQLIEAAIVNISIFVFFRRITSYQFTAVFIYALCAYPLLNFEIMRAALAVSIFLWAYPSYKEGRWLTFYLIITIAFLFHASAIVLYGAPLLRRAKQPIIYVPPLIFLGGIPMVSTINNIVSSHASQSWLFAYAAHYATEIPTGYGLLALALVDLFLPMALLHVSTRGRPALEGAASLAITGIWIGAFSSMFYIVGRLQPFFLPVYIALAAEAVHRLLRARGNSGQRVVSAATILGAFLAAFTLPYFAAVKNDINHARTYQRWYPYHSVFDPQSVPGREALYYASLGRT